MVFPFVFLKWLYLQVYKCYIRNTILWTFIFQQMIAIFMHQPWSLIIKHKGQGEDSSYIYGIIMMLHYYHTKGRRTLLTPLFTDQILLIITFIFWEHLKKNQKNNLLIFIPLNNFFFNLLCIKSNVHNEMTRSQSINRSQHLKVLHLLFFTSI